MDEQAIVNLVPGAVDSDSDGVKMSLEAARALAISGEPEEALRILRRAAEAAEQAGDDMRSITLARAAADIANEVERAKKAAAEADAPASKREPPSPPSRKSVPTPTPTPAPASTSADTTQDQRESDAPQPSAKATVHEAVHTEPERPAALAKKAETRPIATPHVAAHGAAAAPPGMSELVSQGRAVRVLVKRSARDESLYIVRPHSTAHVPVGAREAFLVLGDADPDFLAGATR